MTNNREIDSQIERDAQNAMVFHRRMIDSRNRAEFADAKAETILRLRRALQNVEQRAY